MLRFSQNYELKVISIACLTVTSLTLKLPLLYEAFTQQPDISYNQGGEIKGCFKKDTQTAFYVSFWQMLEYKTFKLTSFSDTDSH